MEMEKKSHIIIEVIYKADYCLPCYYMDKAVQDVLSEYGEAVKYKRIDFLKGAGKDRFLQLSYSLFGKEAVHKYCRVAPVPSLFINGELFFDAIPPSFELKDAINSAILKRKRFIMNTKKILLEVFTEGDQ